MSWLHLSDGLLLATTGVYALSMLAFGLDFALGQAALPRRSRITLAAPGASLRAARPRPAPPARPEWIRHRAAVGRIGVRLTGLGVLLHGGCLLARALAAGRPPLSSMFEFTVAAAFVATLTYLGIGLRTGQLRQLGLLAMLPVTVAMLLALTIYDATRALPPSLQSYWLSIHVTAAAVGVGALTVGTVGCAIQLIAQEGEWRQAILPQPDAVARVAFAFAFPIWTFAVLTGAIWAEHAWGRYWAWDPKEVWAFVSWILLAAYLHSRRTGGVRGRTVAIVGVAAYGTLLFNLIAVNLWFGGLHSYSGL